MVTLNINRSLILISLFSSLLLSAVLPFTATADNISFEVSLDRDLITIGQSLQLNLEFQSSKNVPAPKLAEIEGIQSRYIGPSTMMSIVNGSVSSSVTHMYSLTPVKTGVFEIGPFSFQHKSDTYTSNAVRLEVVDRQAAGESSRRHGGAENIIKERLFLTMETGKQKAYINEIIPLKITLYRNGLNLRDIEYPVFEHEGFSIGKYGEPEQYKERRGSLVYDAIEFKTDIFATRTGKASIGPVSLKSSLLSKRQRHGRSSAFNIFGSDPFNDLFGYETTPIELSAEQISFEILPFPEDGRPGSFNGAVGSFGVSVNASPLEVKEGDPITLKITVTGDGNLGTVSMPELMNDGSFKTYKPRVTIEGDVKTFEQVLIPTRKDIDALPGLTFSYFDPEPGEYRTIRKNGLPIKVLELKKKEEIAILDAPQGIERTVVVEKLGRDIIYIKASPGKLSLKGDYLYNKPFFYFLQILPLLLLAAAVVIKKKRDRLLTDTGYARRVHANPKARKGIKTAEKHLHADDLQGFYSAVDKTAREYIGNRFHVSSAGMTFDIVDSTLKEKGISREILEHISDIFRECDMARYAPSELKKGEMQLTLDKLKEMISYLERAKL